MTTILEKLITGWCWFSVLILLSGTGFVLSTLYYKGMPHLDGGLIFGSTSPMDALLLKRQVFDGLFPAIIGTLLLVLLSISWALPVGLAAGIYLSEYAQGRVKLIFDILFDLLASIPSILIGLFGFSLVIILHRILDRLTPSLLISSLSLALLVLPYIIRTTQVSLESLPLETRLTGYALGATRLQNIFFILLPRSLNEISSGIILAIGRCAEDTAVIMLTGAVATAGIPRSLLSQYEALPFYIYTISAQYTDRQELMTGYSASIILLTLCLLLFGLAALLKKRLTQGQPSH
ncbi:MAG: ABC transporter permease subunit [Thermodesulfobacteriota bacterium]|nr:ABC transporter permease subunit [Thermodesulfobacteriota bacterium]